MKLSRKAAAAVLAVALTLSLCVISALPGGQPRMDAMTYNIDTLPARDPVSYTHLTLPTT